MSQRFKPFPPVSCQHGAPMGRMSANIALDPEFDKPESLGVAGPAGEYDAGGVYWGYSPLEGPVWAIWRKGASHEGVVYVRAHGRESAKRVALGLA